MSRGLFECSELSRHESIQRIMFGKIRSAIGNLEGFVDEKLRVYLNDLEAIRGTNTDAVLESTSDYVTILKELNEWFSVATAKYGISVSQGQKTSTDYILPKEHKDSQKLNFEMEKIKSFLFVKNQKDTISNIEKLERVMDNLLQSFIGKSQDVDLLQRKERSLESTVYTLNSEILKRIDKIQEETLKIEIIKYGIY